MKNQFRKRLYSDLSPSLFKTKGKIKWICRCGSEKFFSLCTEAVICSCGSMMEKEPVNEEDYPCE